MAIIELVDKVLNIVLGLLQKVVVTKQQTNRLITTVVEVFVCVAIGQITL